MIAVFSDEQKAIKLIEKLHDWLTNNCPNYNAITWMTEPLKHPLYNKWGVFLPVEYIKQSYVPKEDLKIVIKAITDFADNIISKLPDDFNTNVEPI